MPTRDLDFQSKVFKKEVLDSRRHQGVRRARRARPVSAAAQGLRRRQADRRHRLGLAGPGAGAEPARLARGHRHAASRSACDAARRRGRPRREAGFTEQNGTLGEMFEVDPRERHGAAADQRRRAEQALRQVFEALRPGSHARACRTASCSATSTNEGKQLPEEHQRHRGVPEGHGPDRAPPLRAGQERQRRRHQRQLRRASGRRRTRHGPRARLVGRARLAVHVPDHARVASSRATSSASAASCSAPCTAWSRACTAASSARGHEQGRRLPALGRVDHRARSRRPSRSEGILAVYERLRRCRQGRVRAGLRRHVPGGARDHRRDLRRGVERQRDPQRQPRGRAPRALPHGQDRRHRDVEGRREGARASATRPRSRSIRSPPASTSPP